MNKDYLVKTICKELGCSEPQTLKFIEMWLENTKLFDDKQKDYGKSNISATGEIGVSISCLLYTSPSPRDLSTSRMPSSA